MWPVFTKIGDAAMTLPAAFICTVWIARSDVRLAFRWVLALALGMALVGVTKILYAGWDISFPAFDFRVISGHAMLSTSVWTVAFTLLLRSWRQPPYIGVVAGLLLGALTGLARVHDHSHSLSEVAIGWALGVLVAAAVLRSAWRVATERFSPVGVTAALLFVSVLTYGHTAPFERLIDAHSAGLHNRFAANIARFF
ncbi:MAG: phosphatase PAP2 family protein [Pseudomonadota bacterium]|jgi:membrane-associated phospholipid phosphatase|uniref:Membrane-associated phospholipid phosphatase n=1 Tax=Caballeronia sordidicola TaxID=196367 RepID=A0A242MBM2_CABSO|nr:MULTISPECIES: phosphatase PAP2 family protein [Burkholderiaceae]AMH43206.1 phosphoesterase PA-phosphatase [Burkholderia sp. PAMC 26561]AMM15817.1 phosphoesterase PA-phosphatase [Burkholderia sp. PAMC 28687]MDP9156614.1 phosphatase PAP2 family protein [Pseudomonadota bacterium]OTP68341.1 Membrane-associated phospholipid phosphatase [Caballeronia sordidicola]